MSVTIAKHISGLRKDRHTRVVAVSSAAAEQLNKQSNKNNNKHGVL